MASHMMQQHRLSRDHLLPARNEKLAGIYLLLKATNVGVIAVPEGEMGLRIGCLAVNMQVSGIRMSEREFRAYIFHLEKPMLLNKAVNRPVSIGSATKGLDVLVTW